MVELAQLEQRLAQLVGERAFARRQFRRQQLHERPAESACERPGERGLSRAGRTEHQHGRGGTQTRLRRQRRIRQRRHDAPVDERLLALHARGLVPQFAVQDLSAPLVDGAHITRLQGKELLVEHHARARGEAAVEERLLTDLARSDQCGDLAHAKVQQSLFKTPCERGSDAAPSPGGIDGHHLRPGPVAGDTGTGHADQRATCKGDHRDRAIIDVRDELRDLDRRAVRERPEALEKLDGGADIGGCEVADLNVHARTLERDRNGLSRSLPDFAKSRDGRVSARCALWWSLVLAMAAQGSTHPGRDAMSTSARGYRTRR